MIMRLVAIVLIAIALVGIFGNLSPQGNLEATFQSLQTSMTTVAYAGKFDERLNNLQLVKMYCDEEISTLKLVNENNPYEKIQQICPKLQEISLSKAAQLFGLI